MDATVGRPRVRLLFLVLGIEVVLAALEFYCIYQGWWPLVAFLTLLIMGLPFFYAGLTVQSDAAGEKLFAVSLVIYLVAVMVGLFVCLPWAIPRLIAKLS